MQPELFFYREIANDYRYEFSNSYARYLVKSEDKNNVDAVSQVTVEQLDASSVRIKVQTDVKDRRLIADVKLAWSSAFTADRVKDLAVRRIVSVEGVNEYLYPKEDFDCWFVPESSDGWYIPIMIESGIGEVTIKSNPSGCTEIAGVTAYAENLYDADSFLGEWECKRTSNIWSS